MKKNGKKDTLEYFRNIFLERLERDHLAQKNLEITLLLIEKQFSP